MRVHRTGTSFAIVIAMVLSLSLTRAAAASEGISSSGDSRLAATAPAAHVQGFHLVSAAAGWLLLDQRLYWTNSLGAAWQDITPRDLNGFAIRTVAFLDDRSGWIVLSRGQANPEYALARTEDQGATFTFQPLSLFDVSDPDALASSVFIDRLDGQTAWLAFKRISGTNFSIGALFGTTDGGQHWTRLALPLGEPIYFADANSGWIAGGAAGNQLYRSLDSGRTWEPVSLGFAETHGSVQSVYLPKFKDSQTGTLPVIIGTGSQSELRFYETRDGGTAWQLSDSVLVGSSLSGGTHIPLALSTADQWIAKEPGSIELVSRAQGGPVVRRAGSPETAGIQELKMATQNVGWARTVSNACQFDGGAPRASGSTKVVRACTTETSVISTQDGGVTWTRLNLPGVNQTVLTTTRTFDSASLSPTTTTGYIEISHMQGFDKCQVGTQSELQDWWNTSPYYATNLYIGGSMRACSNSDLSATYISQLRSQGWSFILTWVGPQSMCYGYYRSNFSNDPSTAYNQGIAEANAAVATAASLGLTNVAEGGTIIYYDLEAYSTGNLDLCREAAKAFISGWVWGLHAKGNTAGVYGASCGTYVSDYITIANVPDDLWVANWDEPYFYNPNATVWGNQCLSDGLWANHQRLRQYAGGHNETWGGTTLNIDNDVMEGHVATGSWGVAPTKPTTPSPSDGALLGRTNDTVLTWRTSGESCSVHIWGAGIDVTMLAEDGCARLHLGPQYSGNYSWQVTAHNQVGDTSGPIWRFSVRPHAPTGLTATGVSISQIDLKWTPSPDPVRNSVVTLYFPIMGSAADGHAAPTSTPPVLSIPKATTMVDNTRVYADGSLMATLLPTVTTYSRVGLNCGTTQSFYVTAVAQGVESLPSNTATGQTIPCYVNPTSVWQTDGSGTAKTSFSANDSIRYYADIETNSPITQTANYRLTTSGGCGLISYSTGTLQANPGHTTWFWPTKMPVSIYGGSVTYRLEIAFAGVTSAKSTTFNVNGHAYCNRMPIIGR